MGQSVSFTDYYGLLGIMPSADSARIRQAFLRKAKQNHPDIGGSADVMQGINEAYKTLISPASRAAYDLLHSFHTGTSEISYRQTNDPSGREPNAAPLSDDYIDWFLDTIYDEYSNEKKPRLTFGKRIKKAFNVFSDWRASS